MLFVESCVGDVMCAVDALYSIRASERVRMVDAQVNDRKLMGSLSCSRDDVQPVMALMIAVS